MDGLAFVVDGQRITAEQLYGQMLERGYSRGTKARLLSCYSGAVENRAASQPSKLTQSMVGAPKSWLTIADQRRLQKR
jgi:hypothetical protein